MEYKVPLKSFISLNIIGKHLYNNALLSVLGGKTLFFDAYSWYRNSNSVSNKHNKWSLTFALLSLILAHLILSSYLSGKYLKIRSTETA